MTTVITVSTLYQAANIAALAQQGMLGDLAERRILVVSNNSYAPELVPAAHEQNGFEAIRQFFDKVIYWNDTIWPNHPKTFGLSPSRAPIVRRLLEYEWGLDSGEVVDLVLESLPGAPAGTLAEIFWDCPISVHSDGLMSYGPIRQPLPRSMFQRLTNSYYTDLIDDVEPRQLAEHEPHRVKLPRAELAKVFSSMADIAATSFPDDACLKPAPKTAVILGQYLANIDLISHDDEVGLHLSMVEEAVNRGCDRIIFKPHPTATNTVTDEVRKLSEELNTPIEVCDLPILAEVLFARVEPALVISCFSTALITARQIYGITTVAFGTEMALEHIAPYQNSNRIPVTIVDFLNSADRGDSLTEGVDLDELVGAVSYCMQPRTLSAHRAQAEAFLSAASPALRRRYFKRRRLTKLGLPGALPAPTTRQKARRIILKGGRAGVRALKRTLGTLGAAGSTSSRS